MAEKLRETGIAGLRVFTEKGFRFEDLGHNGPDGLNMWHEGL
jgi:hypothetical protein